MIGNEPRATLKVSLAAILAALGVTLSYWNPFAYVTIFGAKINPFAHFINALAGVLLGPYYAITTATSIAIIRFSLGIGTILAFPGGISGALVVGLAREIIARRKPRHTKAAAFTEPIGTVFIGGTIATLLVPTPVLTFWWLFALSCIPGAILGWVLLKILENVDLLSDILLPSRTTRNEVDNDNPHERSASPP